MYAPRKVYKTSKDKFKRKFKANVLSCAETKLINVYRVMFIASVAPPSTTFYGNAFISLTDDWF